MARQVKLRYYRIGSYDLYGYRINTDIYPKLSINETCYDAINHSPFSIVAYAKKIDNYDDRDRWHAAAYDLTTGELVLRYAMSGEDLKKAIGQYKKRYLLMVSFNTEYRSIILEPITKIILDEDGFILEIPPHIKSESDNIHHIVEQKSECHCDIVLKRTNPGLLRLVHDQLSTMIEAFGHKFHPVFIADQEPKLTAKFRKNYSEIPGDYNNLLICSDEYPTLLY